VANTSNAPSWGQTPWVIDFHPQRAPLPEAVDIAVIGGGFTGLSAAAAIRSLNPEKTVAVLEAETIGARSSGYTGGLTLSETAAGDLPGLGDVLAGLSEITRQLNVTCELMLPGARELDRTTRTGDSPICWSDSGRLRVAREVPGGTVDPGKLVSGLGRAAAERGVLIFEGARVDHVDFSEPLALQVGGRQVRAQRVLIATNSESLELSDLTGRADPKLTLALATESLNDTQLSALGLASGKPFYTIDLPYLWGRLLRGNRIIFGSGLVPVSDWRELKSIDIRSGDAAAMVTHLEKRVSKLHPSLAHVGFSHRWGGPILIADEWRPVFGRHPRSERVIVLGGYSGHGVALSVYLGAWAAEALLDRRELPAWHSH
jgi:glycine/D-amino acid oxidase-like deaminating enzyme